MSVIAFKLYHGPVRRRLSTTGDLPIERTLEFRHRSTTSTPLDDLDTPDGLARPLTQRDVFLGTACAEALARFFAEHGSRFEDDVEEAVSAEYTLDELPGAPKVAVAFPHPGAHWLFEDEAEDGPGEDVPQEDNSVERLRQTVPKKMRDVFLAVVALTDDACARKLDDEYAEIARKMAASLARKRPSPLSRGRVESWACAVVYTVGFVNFLFDKSERLHLTARELCKVFGVSQSNASAKATAIKKMLDVIPFDRRFCLPSKMEDNPLVWMIEIDGIVVDARRLPRTLQKRVLELGLIPYLP